MEGSDPAQDGQQVDASSEGGAQSDAEMCEEEGLEGDSGSEEEEDGSSSDEEDEEEGEEGEGDSGAEDPTQDSDDSSSGDESEHCPICLLRFRDQDIGTPEGCDHSFCLECIVEWSKNVNSCPVDRQVFNLVLAKHGLEEPIYKRIPVKDHVIVDNAEFDDTTECEVCGRADNEDRMLLCDGCNLGFHLYCLDPPLTVVPRGNWYCLTCQPAITDGQEDEIPVEVESEEEEVVHMPQQREFRYVEDIQIGRTLVRERVLARITRNRGGTRVIESDSDSDYGEGDSQAPSTSQPKKPAVRKPRRKVAVKRKRKIKRKTKASSSRKTGAKKTTKKRRKKKRKGGKRVLARTKKLRPTTPKVRIANRLGLSSPPVGRQIPLVKGHSSDRLSECLRGDATIRRPLNILGDRNEIMHFSDQSEEDEISVRNSGSTMVARPSVPRIGRPIKTKAALKACPSALSARTAFPGCGSPSHGTTCDLLGSIFQEQDMLAMKSDKLTIHRDGSLTVAPDQQPPSKRARKSSPEDGGDSNSPNEPDNSPDQQQPEQQQQQTPEGSDTAPQNCGVEGGQGDSGGGNSAPLPGDNDNTEGGGSHHNDPSTTNQSPVSSQKRIKVLESEKEKYFPKPELKLYSSSSSDDEEAPVSLAKTELPSVSDELEGSIGSEEVSDLCQMDLAIDEEEEFPLEKDCGSAEEAENNASEDRTDNLDASSPVEEVEDAEETAPGEEEEEEEDDDDDDEKQNADGVQMIPFSELPRIPKLKKKSPERNIEEELEEQTPADDSTSGSSNKNSSHTSVLERLNMGDRGSYGKWDKSDRKDRRSRDRDDGTDHRDDRGSSDRRSRYRERHSTNNRDSEYDRQKYRRRSRSRSRDKDRDRSTRDRNSRSRDSDRHRRSRSRDRNRRRSRSRSRERLTDRRRSREHSRRTRSRTRSPKRRDDSTRDRSSPRRRDDSFRDRASPKRRDDSFHDSSRDRGSPRRREDSFHDTIRDRGSSIRSSDNSYKGSAKMFSQSLKQVAPEPETQSPRLKLNRSFLSEIQEKFLKTAAKDLSGADKDNSHSSVGKQGSPSTNNPIVVNIDDDEEDNNVGDNMDIEPPSNETPPKPFMRDTSLVRSKTKPLLPPFERKVPAPLMGERPPSPTISELEVLRDGPFQPFKVPGAMPPRLRVPEVITGITSHASHNDTYDPSQPTDANSSPPPLDIFQMPPQQFTGERHSPLQPRLPFPPSGGAEMLRPHRPPLLADPVPQREGHPGPPPFVTVTDNIRQILPGLPGFGVLPPGMPRNVRPPLLMNPPLIGPPQMGRLPRLGGPPISWQAAISHPNVILHNRLPIQMSQNGMPLPPTGPEAFLQRQHLEHRVSQAGQVPDSLATPPPPLPPKALEEMQQISQLLNAQAHLAHFIPKTMEAPPGHLGPPFEGADSLLGGHPSVLHALGGPNKLLDQKSVTFDERMEVVDMDVASPLSDEGGTFSPPQFDAQPTKVKPNHHRNRSKGKKNGGGHDAMATNKDEDGFPKSATELGKSEKFMKKLNRQERVVEEVKLAIKPHYSRGKLDKDEYKEILRKAVPKICHSKSGDINPEKIRNYIEQYVAKIRLQRKYSASKDKKEIGGGNNSNQRR